MKAARECMNHKSAMDREHWLAASPYLDEALDLPVEQLESWILQLQSTKPDIAADIRRLLAFRNADPLSSFLSDHVDVPPRPEDAQYLREGELLGSYRVLRELGRGGMAVVYLAERADGHFEQQVALKILRFGTQGTAAQHHFAQERQILASLHHPAIARLIDGGITDSGLHYLAMEYVDGLRIDRYCDEHCLRIEDRLRLFLKVADAVQYAHRRLIVHRDLKPSNIVVAPDGTVKLLDFGIAKLLDPGQMAHTAPPTLDVVRLMTPEYASPEQARGADITTATDTYQLGLLLYELLTGHQPYDVRGRKALDALRVICESEPMRLDAAVSNKEGDAAQSPDSISAARATTPERLRRLLSRDLQAIVLMTLRKEPEHRYGSVGQLMEDIVRYLDGLPVHAYKGVWGYTARKFVHRHTAGLAISGIAVCAFVFMIVWYTIQLAHERDRAASEAATASQISEFLATVFRGSTNRSPHADITAREMLDHGADRIETELSGQPQIQGRLLNVIGNVYVQYHLFDKARPLLDRALSQNTRVFGEQSKEVADTKFSLGRLAGLRGDFKLAKQLLQDTAAIRERTLGPRSAETAHALAQLAFVLSRLEELDEALRICERAIGIYAQSVGEEDERALSARIMLASIWIDRGEPQRAKEYLENLVPKIEHSLGPNHQYLGTALQRLAESKYKLGDYDGIEQQLRRVIAIDEKFYGPDHGNVLVNQSSLGSILYETGRFKDAIAVLERMIETQRRVNRPGHPYEGTAQMFMGHVLYARGDLKSALSRYQMALDIYRASWGKSHGRYADALCFYGEIQMEMGNLSAAATALEEAVATMRRTQPAGDADIGHALVSHAVLLTRTGNPVEAEKEIREALSYYQNLPPEHFAFAPANGALGEALLAQGRLPEAEGLLLQSAKQLGKRLHQDRRASLQRLIQLYERKHDQQSVARFRNELVTFEREVRSR